MDAKRRELNVLIALQARGGLGDRHLLSIDASGFTLAHTNAERHRAEWMRRDLEGCPLHRWLCSYDAPPLPDGIWEVHWDGDGGYALPYGGSGTPPR